MADKIKISNAVKFTQLSDLEGKPSHLWAVENELDAEEIKSIIEFASRSRFSIAFPNLSTFSYSHSPQGGNPKFAIYETGNLIVEEIVQVINADLDFFKELLGNESLPSLRNIYSSLVRGGYRTQKKGLQVKKDYLEEISCRLEDLVHVDISRSFAAFRCISLGDAERENELVSSSNGKLMFSSKIIPTLSEGTIQYWKIEDLSISKNSLKLSPEFFKKTTSTIDQSDSTNHCILNLKEPKADEVLQEFISQQKGGEFMISPLTLRIGYNLLHDKFFREPDLFSVKWPNNRAALAKKFGIPQKRTKFETLKLGLLLPDRLEQVQKMIKALSGQKIVLNIGTRQSSKYFCLGELLSASVTEALILHLKIDYIPPEQKSLVFCEVQEKMTEETLAFIWQVTEEHRLNCILFLGFQLTE